LGRTVDRSSQGLRKRRTVWHSSSNTANPTEEHINERIHWSVVAKHLERTAPLYDPPNLPPHIPADGIATLTDQERQPLERGT